MFPNLRQDVARLRESKARSFPWFVIESLLFENGFQAVVLYRIAHWFKRRGIPFFGPFFGRLGLFLTGVDIAPAAEIGPGLRISHGTGIVIGHRVRLGAGATLLHNVTLGGRSAKRPDEMPRIGNHVFIGAGASILGDVEIGDRVFVGSGAMVMQDVPTHSKVVATGGIELVTSEPIAAADEDSSS